MNVKILGISGYYHDSAAALIIDGNIIAAAQEERFTRKKHDASFPAQAILFCLNHARLKLEELDAVVFYDKPFLTFERLLETYLDYAPKGFASFMTAMPVWLKEKLFLKSIIKKELASLANLKVKQLPQLLFSEHHKSHAASAFYPSPFNNAAILCLDGVGEWATSTVWRGNQNTLSAEWQINFPHSLGLLYSAFTYYAGFKVNSGEYKLMGLAPYGTPRYVDVIRDNLIDIKQDGTFRLNMLYFDYAAGLKMTNNAFANLFGSPARKPETTLTQFHMDIARSVQAVTEEILMKLAVTLNKELETDYLCLAGGVALNCVANGRLLREGPFRQIWIQPAAGDAGCAIGSALLAYHEYFKAERTPHANDNMQGSYLGPDYSEEEIESSLKSLGASYEYHSHDSLHEKTAELLAEGNVIGWFQGRMEFGPRALGNRSIIGDPRNTQMQSVMNLKIKYRESFRPFAPAVKVDKASEWFHLDQPSPYMLFVAPVNSSKCKKMSEEDENLFGIDKLNIIRSDIPAVTHVDYSARIQTVDPAVNSSFYKLLDAFDHLTGCPVIVNTSFNVRGEPIVCTPRDAYYCFMRTEMDYLVIGNFVMAKSKQPTWRENDNWRHEFTLD